MATQAGSLLATRRGRLTLLLLCAVQFLDIADSSIMNVALPSIRRDLGFSVQGLQWVLSGYLHALTAGFHQALLACAIFLLAAAGIALRATNTHGEPTAQPAHLPESHGPMATPELTDQDQPTPAHTPQQTQPR